MNARKLMLLFFCLIPLAVYHIPIGPINLSIDRLLLILVLLIIPSIELPSVKNGFLVVFILVLTSVLSMAFASNYKLEGLIYFGPSWFQSIMVFYISLLIGAKYGPSFTDKVFRIHFYMLLLLTLYGFWFVYIQSDMSFKYPLSSFLPEFEADRHKFTMLRNHRLFFPFSSAPRLGFVGGVLMIYFWFFHKSKKEKWIMSLLSLFIVLVTISRGPIFSLILSFGLTFIIVNSIRTRFFNIIMSFVFLVMVALMLIQFDLSDDSMFARLFSVGSDDASLQGHYNVRVRVLSMIFGDDWTRLFFGYGLGQIDDILNVTSAHSSYFTQLFEQGLVGVFAFALMYLIIIRKAVRYYLLERGKVATGLLVLALYLGVIHLAYDAISMVVLWAYNGFVWAYLNYKEKNYHADKCSSALL